jgi:hypothetical protein
MLETSKYLTVGRMTRIGCGKLQHTLCYLSFSMMMIMIIMMLIIIIIINWYEHVTKSAETSQGGKVTVLWNQNVQSDRSIPNNKPDIVIRDNEKGTCMLIDVAISGDRNMI